MRRRRSKSKSTARREVRREKRDEGMRRRRRRRVLTALEDIVDQDGIRVLRFADLELGAGEICVPVVPGEQAPLLDRRLERHFLGGAVWRVRAARACEVREVCRCGRVFLRATSPFSTFFLTRLTC